ncbi:MAG TPA: protein kinase, partial [Polyangiales bacterium]|nr:protein kinase [Polyangiales bacterium]
MTVGSSPRYESVELLGRGGMGAVYRCFDSVRAQVVALKRLALDPETRHREERIALFHREYRTLAELKHPCVIDVFDYGVDAEGPYYTMELLDGADVASKAPMAAGTACSLARDICSSLALLHSRGYVHRDVSPLNVRCTENGRAKLLDFGAMVPMGISTLTMGTPPCIAPEALGLQPLDGRTDLFALGATLYFTLTGRHAYPARNLTQLSVLHERTPRPPSAYASEVSPALDRLVMSLLSMDPMARPRHAAEVMDRLTTLAELAPLEQIEVHQSYLNTPELVGRSATKDALAEALRRTLSGQGTVIRLHAAEGGGRTRMLQAGVMDARLAGVRVLRADCAQAADRPYGVLRALAIEVQEGSVFARELLGQRPALHALMTHESADTANARESILLELSSLFVELARAEPLLIAVDDIDRCDEPSLAALSTLASRIGRTAIELIYTDITASKDEPSSALALLHEFSNGIELEPLDEPATEALLGSVFGRVPNLATMARYVYERASGNPRWTMELAQALVERKLARYELGSWSLPGEIANDALPASMLDARRVKLEALGDDARELAQVLALVHGYAVPLEALAALTDHADPERFSEAHALLLTARVVEPREAQVLADRSWLELARQSIDEGRRRRVYARLSQLLDARGEGAISITRCLLHAGEPAQALDRLCGALARGTLIDDSDSDYPELLQEAESHCAQLDRPICDRFYIQREFVALADRFVLKGLDVYFHSVLRQLCHDTGLDDWERLAGQVAEEARLGQALTAAQARYDTADPADRVLAPIDAIKCLVETVYAGAIYAAVIGDRVLLDSLPSLE